MKWRYFLLHLFYVFLVVLVVLRLGYWQIVKNKDFSRQALFQRSSYLEIPSPRGDILSSDSFPLTTNQEGYLFYVDPKNFHPTGEQLGKIKSVLDASDSARLNLAFAKNQLSWFPVSHHLSHLAKQNIESLNLKGLGFEPEPTRMYPEASISAHLLGFVGLDTNSQSKGYFGLEGYYDRQLSGKPGKLIQEKDALDRPILIGDQNILSPQSGSTLVTSIDRRLQFIAYQKLAQGLARYGAKSGTVTIMEPQTGRILAMVSLPNYDPGSYRDFDPYLYKNPTISDGFEPGSTFKVLMMAAALDTHAVSPDTICDICGSQVTVSDYPIKTWNEKYYPGSNMVEVIQHSDNVGMVFVSRRLGHSRELEYIKKFGFGKLTGIDLQEESSPALRPEKNWVDIDYATASFGQGIAVTPVQMVRAVAAIANRGFMPTPRMVDKVVTGSLTKNISTSPSVAVISPITAAQMTQIMVNAVDNGEAKWAKPAGVSIAGKTGTAQIPVLGHYDKDKTIASFVGFAPAEKPKFVMLVTLREPQTSPWGSETAAPLWFDISRDIFRLLK